MKKYFTLFAVVLIIISQGILSPVSGQWHKEIIDDGLTNATLLDVADLDGDGDKDLTLSDWRMDAVFWYENEYPIWQRYDVA